MLINILNENGRESTLWPNKPYPLSLKLSVNINNQVKTVTLKWLISDKTRKQVSQKVVFMMINSGKGNLWISNDMH